MYCMIQERQNRGIGKYNFYLAPLGESILTNFGLSAIIFRCNVSILFTAMCDKSLHQTNSKHKAHLRLASEFHFKSSLLQIFLLVINLYNSTQWVYKNY